MQPEEGEATGGPALPVPAPSTAQHLAEAQYLAEMGSWAWEEAHAQMTWSDGLYRLLGLEPQECEPSYQAYLDRVHPDDRATVEQAVTSAIREREAFEFDHRVLREGVEELWLRGRVHAVRNAQGDPERLVATALDVTASKSVEAWLRGQRDRMAAVAAVVESTDDSVIVTSPDGTILSWNEAARRLYGYTSAEAVGEHIGLILSAKQLARLPETIARLREERHVRIDSVDVHKDGSQVFASVTLSQVTDEAGRVVAHVGIARDVARGRREARTERQHVGQLAHLAFRDPLTGLANRWLLHDRLTQALARRGEFPTCVLLLDLDDFKTVNDISGHAAGDRLLAEVARRLVTCVREEDLVARLGGDEFAIVVHDGDPQQLAERMLQVLAEPVTVEGRRLVPGGSIGIAEEDGTADSQELLLRADVAMYEAKAAGKGCVARFTPSMAEAVRARAETEARLREAVGRDEIVVHYQPIVDVQAESVSRVEALVRWQRDGALVPPAEFLPLAEDTGLIVGIGREVLRQACAQLRDWLAQDPHRTLAVNVSAAQLHEPGFADYALAQLADNAIAAEHLVLEVTETLFLEVDARVIDELVALRAHGVRVSIDDFGTGYSSLGLLQALPVDSLKIDKSFVDLINTGDEDLPILTSIILMAHSLGLDVTAEGVETAAQATRLISLGCDYLQGYHFARPEPAQRAQAGAAAEALEALNALVGGDGTTAKILLIEDDPVWRLLVATALPLSGFDVTLAASGLEGLAQATREIPDCILIDLQLHDTDGLEVLRALRARPELAATAIVVITQTADRPVRAAAFAGGADDYVVKPVVMEHLTSRLRVAIRSARQSGAVRPDLICAPRPAPDPDLPSARTTT